MKKKSIITMVAALALVGAIGVGSTLAYFTDNDAASNTRTMGHVDIELSETSTGEYEELNKGLKFTNIVPGDEISKVPVIEVVKGSEDCYLRAKIEITDLDDIEDGYAAELLSNINTGDYDWVKGDDDYFYYVGGENAGIVGAEDEITLFTTVKIPTGWGNEVADKTFDINITVEAIQADNFEPTTTDGVISWGDVTAETYNAPDAE